MTLSRSLQMLLKLETCIPTLYVTLETVPKCANVQCQDNLWQYHWETLSFKLCTL